MQEREENTDDPPPTPEAAAEAAANTLKEKDVERPPPVRTVGVCTSPTAKNSQARGQRAENSGSRGVATSVGVGTSVASTSPIGSPATSTPRATFTFKMSPRTSRRSKIVGSQPLVSVGARQRATTLAARSAVSGAKVRDRRGSGGSDSSTSSSSSAVAAAAAAGRDVLKDQGAAPEAAGNGAEPTSGDLERTLLVDFRSAEFDGQSEEEEKAGGEQPTTDDFEATAVVGFSAGESRDEVVGKREESLLSGGAGTQGGEEMIPTGNGGHPPRNKKRSRVTPLGAGEPNSQPVKGEVGSMRGEGSATSGGINTGDGQNLSGGSGASGGVVHKKRLSDAGVQCARPAETSEIVARGQGRGRCACVVM